MLLDICLSLYLVLVFLGDATGAAGWLPARSKLLVAWGCGLRSASTLSLFLRGIISVYLLISVIIVCKSLFCFSHFFSLILPRQFKKCSVSCYTLRSNICVQVSIRPSALFSLFAGCIFNQFLQTCNKS